MRDERDGYQAYLLRLWRVRCQGQWQWRASIDSPNTGERRSFADLSALAAFLDETTRRDTPGVGVGSPDASPGSAPLEEKEKQDV